MELQLKVLLGIHAGRIVTVRTSGFLIGRSDVCDLRMRSHRTSRRHCQFVFQDDQAVVEDLGSSNGTFVNGARLEVRHALAVGDRILVPPLEFEVVAITPAATAAAAAASPAADTTASVGDADDEFASSVCEWMTSEGWSSAASSPSEHEQQRFSVSDTVALARSDTVDIEGKELKQQVAEAAGRNNRGRRSAAPPKKRFVAPRRTYSDSGQAAAESLRAFFGKR